MPGLPYPINLDFDQQPYREHQLVSREVALFDPSLGREIGQIARVSVNRRSCDFGSRDFVGTAFEQYDVLWGSGEITHDHSRQGLKSEQWTAAEINAAEKEAEGFQANIAWD